jgi:hypothetical protein
LENNEKVNLLADSHNILNRWKNYFSQLLNAHTVSNVRQMETNTDQPSITEPSPIEIENATPYLKRYEPQSTDQI